MAVVLEAYRPRPMVANSSHTLTSHQHIGGFLAKTSGTITVTNSAGTVVVDAVPVTAGVYTPIPFTVGVGAIVQLAGGASGSLGLG